MTSTSEKVLQLRRMLSERFGEAELPQVKTATFGFPALDQMDVPEAALTEIVFELGVGAGGSLFLYGLLHAALKKGDRVALIDGKDSFQPKGLPAEDLRRLLWTRCLDTEEALKIADLAVRDGNLPLVILWLALNPKRELRRVQNTVWHRLQMLAEKSAVTVLVLTPFPLVGSAQLRLQVGGAFPLRSLDRCRAELIPSLELAVARRRVGHERGCADEILRRTACA